MYVVKKSKFLSLFLLFFLLSGSAGFAAEAALSVERAPVNEAYMRYINNAVLENGANGEEANRGSYSTGYVPSKIDWSHLNENAAPAANAVLARSARAVAPPVSYDLRGDSFMPVRNQDPYGTCWTFAAMAASESNLILQGLADATVDLSEWYLAYYAYNDESPTLTAFPIDPDDTDPYYEQGGDDWIAAAILTRGTGPVFETDAPYPVDEEGEGHPYTPSLTAQRYKLRGLFYLGDAGVKEPQFDELRAMQIKEALLQYGALSIGIKQEDWELYFNPATAAYYRGDDEADTDADHAVTLVGWDDNYPKTNFGDDGRPEPDADGAWIVRNSWDDDWGDEGYYYISYEERTLRDGVAYQMTTAAPGETIYQYDPTGLETFIDVDGAHGEGEGPQTTAWFANVFQAQRNESIGSVAFYTSMPGTQYEIALYSGLDAKNSGPVSGEPVQTFTGTLEAPGYNTVDLPKAQSVQKGDRFSVVVKVTMDYEFPIPAGFAARGDLTTGKSWASEDGVTWLDVASIDIHLDDDDDDDEEEELVAQNVVVCLKAFATPANQPWSNGGSSGCNALPLSSSALSLLVAAVVIRRRK